MTLLDPINLDRKAFLLEIVRGLVENHRKKYYLPSSPTINTRTPLTSLSHTIDCKLEKYL